MSKINYIDYGDILKKSFYILIIVIIFSISAIAENYIGTIVSDKNEKFTTTGSFTEENKISFKNTIFLDNDGKLIVEEKAKFTTNPFEILEISIVDKRNDRKEIVLREGERYILKYQKEKGKKIKTKVIEEDGIILHGSVLIMYIIEKLDELQSMKKPLKMKMVVPLRQTFYNFELIKEKSEKIYGQDCFVFKLKASNWIINVLTKSSYFYITKSVPHQIIKYSGATLITDEKEDKVCGEMKIVYE